MKSTGPLILLSFACINDCFCLSFVYENAFISLYMNEKMNTVGRKKWPVTGMLHSSVVSVALQVQSNYFSLPTML